MVVIPTLAGLQTVMDTSPQSHWRNGITFYDQYTYDYATIYRTQPNVRTCVDFLARNIAQLGLHVYRKRTEMDRERLRDHPLARLLSRPLPPECKTSRYTLISSLVSDLGIYFNAYWLKIWQGGQVQGQLRVPPALVTVEGSLIPTLYKIQLSGRRIEVAPENIVHFRGYSPDSSIYGLSPLETLRRILAEEQAAGDYREHFWQNAARMHGVVERPAEAPEWGEEARERFTHEFASMYSGAEASGITVVLEEGMTWRQVEFSSEQAQYLEGRKLTREESARAYHIPPPLVGILDHATFSNIKEQHKSLYTDTLGPWNALIEGEIELQLLPDFLDTEGVYAEFNIAEKLQGDFEEQVKALQSAVGAPYMTRNEARARMNLQSVPGGDELVTPLNVLEGGQASPRDSAPPDRDTAARKAMDTVGTKADGELDATLAQTRARHVQRWREVLSRHFGRQREALLARLIDNGELNALWQGDRWDRELGDDLYRMNVATATVWGQYVAGQLEGEFFEERIQRWLRENARIAAEEINGSTWAQLEAALLQPETGDALGRVFEIARTSRAQMLAESRVTTAANYGAQEAARQNGMTTKTWQVNSTNPRSAHAAMSGETVPIGTRFSNGMLCPGDPAGGAENNSNCQCSLRFGR